MSEIDEIKKLLNKHEKRISELEKLIKKQPASIQIDGKKAILKLIDSGFFDKFRKYGDIIKELKKQAYYHSSLKYKQVLETLTQQDKLERTISHHQWTYKKK